MLGILMLSAAALAPADVPVQTDAAALRVGAELRAEALYENHGLEKEPGTTIHPSTAFEIQHAAVVLDGKLPPEDTDVAFGFDLLHAASSPLDYGYVTHWFGRVVGVSLGKMRVLQGGWDNASYEDFTAHAKGFYADNLVYDANAPMAAVSLRAAGLLTLQFLNDKVVGRDAVASWSKSAHPTWAFGWRGDFGPITPLLDVGSYDNNKSRWVDAGVKTKMNGLTGTLDLFNKNQVTRHTTGTGKILPKADVSTGMTLSVAYEIMGAATPWFYFSTFDDKQGDDRDLGIKDHEFNTTRDASARVSYDTWDDNGQVTGVGINLNALGKGWTPYLALVSRSGKFENQKRPNEAEDKTELWVRFGVLGTM